MGFSVEAVRATIHDLCRTHVAHLGKPWLARLDEVQAVATRLHRNTYPSGCPQAVVFQTLDDSARPLEVAEADEMGDTAPLGVRLDKSVCVQVLANGRLLVWQGDEWDVEGLSAGAVVYELKAGVASMLAAGDRLQLRGRLYGPHGPFDPPSFAGLEESLHWYSMHKVRESSCPYLMAHIWYDEERLFLSSGPEEHMRRSLCDYLTTCFRDDAEVKQEQNVTETEPIDIRIRWHTCQRAALIEIKWLGRPRNPKSRQFGTEYTAWRAHQGAKQLARYLDSGKPYGTQCWTVGWLVVFDARRKNPKKKTKGLCREDGLFYEDRDITYDAKYTTRDDWAGAIRMFAAPRCEEDAAQADD